MALLEAMQLTSSKGKVNGKQKVPGVTVTPKPTYLWWVKRIGFWDFYFELIFATLEIKKIKHHSGMINTDF